MKKYKQWKAIASIEDWLPVDDEFLQDFRHQLDKRKIKTKKQYEYLFKKYFKIVKTAPCIPISNKFKKTYPRYYWENNPMAYVYGLIKR
ncbi:MAG: hypothetical protein R3B41_02115 [Candidatus Doudnabacteria bacterium]